MVLEEFYKLNNGQRIPKIALGTWQTPNDVAATAVATAIDAGYRHIDTAIAYENEAGVGAGLKAALKSTGIHRESVFITTKIPAEVKNYDDAVRCIQESMGRLDAFHIDMMLIHAPRPWAEMGSTSGNRYFKENLEVWKALEGAYEAGKIRAIGVSNFEISDLNNLLAGARVIPAVNQIRVHVGHVPTELIDFCEQSGILVEAYSPNATGRLLKVPEVCAMAEKYHVSVPQLASRFVLQLGLLPLPKSVHEERIRQNAKLDFEINSNDMASLLEIDGL
ncbi:aldo/keto reductase [Fibrobacter sp. UWB12]|uniref:aldo/keto reductase family protein n=1 Tax=Fibrobacter sp. UWB12 TaxID=1896203 RepID=UPI0009157231|nr:aldo/keto reductase [Fibrobacter sp. UWB12]SHK88897.1 Aldo/keto reductase [Fibrobacter sp. UWB12]